MYCNVAGWDSSLLETNANAKQMWNDAWVMLGPCEATEKVASAPATTVALVTTSPTSKPSHAPTPEPTPAPEVKSYDFYLLKMSLELRPNILLPN